MFARVKKTGQYEYLQIVQNRREGAKTIQRVVATIGGWNQIQEKGEIENWCGSLSRFSREGFFWSLSGRATFGRMPGKIGPVLICERFWKELRIGTIIRRLLAGPQVRVRCGAGYLPDGSTSALRLRLGSAPVTAGIGFT